MYFLWFIVYKLIAIYAYIVNNILRFCYIYYIVKIAEIHSKSTLFNHTF